jgi:Class III cytochrome C family
MQNKRLGCLTGTGILAALITAFAIAGFAYARGGLMYNPGPLNAQGSQNLGGVTSHAATGGDCEACHTAPWESDSMADHCTACHTDIGAEMHEAATVHGTLFHNGPSLGCWHCHPEHRGADASLTLMDSGSFPHEVVGFSLTRHRLTAARVPFQCADCHHGDVSSFSLDTCDTCHRQMDLAFMTAHTLSFGSACLDCHDGADRFDENFDHNVFSFQLTGRHVGLACVECHINARGLGDFPVTSQDCYSCHHADEPHQGRFGFDCSQCHIAEGWSQATFDHNLAAFKLEGEHQEVACESCHTNGQFTGTPMDCYSCHQKDDEHNGQFGADCAACHNSSNWEDAVFDHNRSNFPLTGAHTALACELCHSSGTFAGLSTQCVSCHGDPVFHAGMFGLDCAACHTTDNWFARYNGPHPRIADEGGSGVNHGGASCRDCHTQTLQSATCLACHDSNNPDGEGGGEGEGD